MAFGTLLKLIGLMNYTLFLWCLVSIRERELCWFSIGFYSDIYRQISFKLSMMIETTKLYFLIPVWMPWLLFKVTVVLKLEKKTRCPFSSQLMWMKFSMLPKPLCLNLSVGLPICPCLSISSLVLLLSCFFCVICALCEFSLRCLMEWTTSWKRQYTVTMLWSRPGKRTLLETFSSGQAEWEEYYFRSNKILLVIRLQDMIRSGNSEFHTFSRSHRTWMMFI